MSMEEYIKRSKWPHLVQRVMRRSSPDEQKKGLDQHFEFDYMGSSEFEWGTLPKSVRRMRELLQNESWEPKKITASTGEEVWYVGSPGRMEIAAEFFEYELNGKWEQGDFRLHALQEGSHIKRAYREPSKSKIFSDPTAWWCMDEYTEPEFQKDWCLLRNKKDADLWLGCLLSGMTKT